MPYISLRFCPVGNASDARKLKGKFNSQIRDNFRINKRSDLVVTYIDSFHVTYSKFKESSKIIALNIILVQLVVK
jgi:hypothetical protein